SVLRRALDGGDESECIVTVARRGYRFVPAVLETNEGENPASRSLAVLPFANLSHDASQDFFSDGMTDELISYLLKIEALQVSARTSVMVYKNAGKPLGEIARELNVQWVVEGAVLQAGGRVRITVRLIEGSTERHLWAETYEKDMRDVLALQSAVASEISNQI